MKQLLLPVLGFYLNVLSWLAPRKAGRTGFAWFCTPVRSPLTPAHHQFFATAETTDLAVANEKIRVYRWGRGPRKVLFLHGWQSHSFRWKNYIEALPMDEYTVYALDAPAHGLSTGTWLHLPKYTAVVQAFFERHGEVDTLIGHSFGSFAALYALYLNPALPVHKLALTGTPGEVEDFMTFYQKMLRLTNRTMGLIYAEFVRQVDRYPSFFSAPRFAETLKLPGVIIHDVGDTDTPFHHAERIHRAWSGSTLIVTEGLGHNLRSARVVERILELVRQPVVGFNHLHVSRSEREISLLPQG
ncbi:MAG: alpha/beta fold hydrolase [Cyclobacteriaceae bacterium]|jgi:pimeloyl-ACP methyl ester carboxylesterase